MTVPETAIDQMQAGVAQMMNASILIQTYTAGLLNQPILTLTGAPALGAHQGAANQAISSWMETAMPQILSSVDAVSGFGNEVGAVVPKLIGLVNAITGGEAQLKPELIDGLTELQAAAGKELLTAQQIEQQLAANQIAFAEAAANFNADLAASQKAGGAEVQELNAKLAEINGALDEDFKTIAAGATNALPGLFLITVGTFVLVASEGEEIEVLKAGIEVTSDELGAVSAASDDARQNIQQYGGALAGIAQLQAELAAVVTIQNAGAGCLTQVNSVQQAASWVTAAWRGIQQTLLGFAQSASKNPDLPPWFADSIQDFGKACVLAGLLAEHLEGFGALTVRDGNRSFVLDGSKARQSSNSAAG